MRKVKNRTELNSAYAEVKLFLISELPDFREGSAVQIAFETCPTDLMLVGLESKTKLVDLSLILHFAQWSHCFALCSQCFDRFSDPVSISLGGPNGGPRRPGDWRPS